MLDWTAADAGPGRERLRLVRELFAIRRREIVPRLAGARFGSALVTDHGTLTADWPMGDGTTLSLIANLSDRDASDGWHETGGTLIWGTALKQSVPPWSVIWRIG
jgi:maltooligosyltrehalose trehalohydrolase